jgi:hypothetical protein
MLKVKKSLRELCTSLEKRKRCWKKWKENKNIKNERDLEKMLKEKKTKETVSWFQREIFTEIKSAAGIDTLQFLRAQNMNDKKSSGNL